MRTKVIKLLDCSSKDSKSKITKPSHDITFLNELIREYLDWMGYKYSSTVFIAGMCDIVFIILQNDIYMNLYTNKIKIILNNPFLLQVLKKKC